VTTIRYAARADWPHPVTPVELRRSRYTFKASLTDTEVRLADELDRLGADRAVVEAAIEPRQVRRDGIGFFANAAIPPHPGVTVTVHAETGVRVFATDVCETWQHNLRSIALGLESLRAVSRYGITPRGEQYAGFLAIESGRPAAMTVERACAALGRLAGWDIPPDVADPFVVQLAYREAVKRHHPDVGGDPADFARLSEAMDVINQPGSTR
jgi:hypothetical protein